MALDSEFDNFDDYSEENDFDIDDQINLFEFHQSIKTKVPIRTLK
jgi:hypothetical protein